jgi:hypothetical protein
MAERMNDMAPIERVKDTLEYCEEHPYWRDKEERERVLRVLDHQLELLQALYPSKESLRRASQL